jgi:hypothetical protein
LEIHQSIAIDALSMPVLGGLWPLFPGGLKEVRGPYFMGGSRESVAYITWGFKGEHSLYFMGDSRGSVTHIEDFRGVQGAMWPYFMEGSMGPWPVFHERFNPVRGLYFKGVLHLFFMGVRGGPWPLFNGGV